MATKSDWPVAAGQSCARSLKSSNRRSRENTLTSDAAADKRSAPERLPERAFFRARAGLLAALEAALCQRWNRRRARLNGALRNLFDKLIRHGNFVEGIRVALTVERLAEMLGVTERTVRRAIALLRTLPELVQVLFVERGETSYDGRPARVPHLEWELGPEAKALLENLADGLATERPPPGHGVPRHPDTVPPDQLLDQIPKSKFGLGKSLEGPPEKPVPKALPPPVESRAPLPPLALPEAELEAIVRQHRRLADPELETKPVYPEELATVDAALATLGPQRPAERLALTAEVSALAKADAARKGQARATLRYAFRPDCFADRMARLREDREQRQRRQADAEMTRQLWPVLEPRPPVRARPTSAQVERHAAAFLAALDGPPPPFWARTASGAP